MAHSAEDWINKQYHCGMLTHDLPHPVPVDPDALAVHLRKCAWKVAAGFPSPAADHVEERIDINSHLIRNKEASFLFGVKSDSMVGIGIYPGDTLLVDRSIEAKHNDIVLAVLDGNFTVKRLYKRGGVVRLVAENNLYPPIAVKEGQELMVWGVVTYNLHKLYG
jgi:DNA polymerase V